MLVVSVVWRPSYSWLNQIERLKRKYPKIFRVLSTGALTHRTLKRLFSTHFIFFSTGLDLQLFSLDLIYISINPLTRLLVPISDALMPQGPSQTTRNLLPHSTCIVTTLFLLLFFYCKNVVFPAQVDYSYFLPIVGWNNLLLHHS